MRSRRCGGGEAVGETQNRPFQRSFNSALRVVSGRAGDLRRWFDSGTRAGRTSRLKRTHGPSLERFAAGQEYPIAFGRSAAAVDL